MVQVDGWMDGWMRIIKDITSGLLRLLPDVTVTLSASFPAHHDDEFFLSRRKQVANFNQSIYPYSLEKNSTRSVRSELSKYTGIRSQRNAVEPSLIRSHY
jgi:hypothetical protein